MMDPAFVRACGAAGAAVVCASAMSHQAPHHHTCRHTLLLHFTLQFVGRKAILDWLNGTFGMHLEKIEETASGA